MCLHIGGLHLSVCSQVVNRQGIAGGTSWAGRLKCLFTHKSAFRYLDFKKGIARKHGLGCKPLNWVCVGISASNFYVSCSLCIRYGNENTHIAFTLRLFIRGLLILVCLCVSDSVCGFCQTSAWAIQCIGAPPGKRSQTERKWAPLICLTKFQNYLGLHPCELPMFF